MGWKGILVGQCRSGVWSTAEKDLHFCVLELRAVSLSLAAFLVVRSSNSHPIRQHCSSGVYQEPRRNTLDSSILRDQGSITVVRSPSHHGSSPVHPRAPEFLGRLGLSQQPSPRDRMDAPYGSLQATPVALPLGVSGPVCHSPQRTVTDLRQSVPRPSSMANRCHVPGLEWSGGVRLPSNQTHSRGAEETAGRTSISSTNSTLLAESAVVSGPPSHAVLGTSRLPSWSKLLRQLVGSTYTPTHQG